MERQRKTSPMVVVNQMLLDASHCVGVVVSEDIRLVCGWAFAGGLGIEKIRFLSDRVMVEAYAFRNCIYLKELVLADGSSVVFEGIDDRKKELPALAKQAVWDRLNCFKTDEQDALIECTGNISRLLVAEGITAIGDNVFQEGNLLTEITLPRTVASIGKNSFAGCKWLQRVHGAQGVRTIGSRAFSGCGSLEEIELSKELTEIGPRAFENCTSLKEILLPEGIEEIPDRAFFRCHSLRRIHLPSTLKRIGKEAFAFCKNLEIPVILDSVLVEERAFVGTVGRGPEDYAVS
ncbi:MAG: leucine-rich repeat domain-containing protein, partial [Acetatifactor sp.]|nr:leucine-rich repeat domain-containing protein [Acetatifactor sp.]